MSERKTDGGKKVLIQTKEDRDLLNIHVCVQEAEAALECFSFFFPPSLSSPSPSVAPFINQPFIKQKQLPALPKRCIDNLDMKTEYLPSLPSTSAQHSAW